MFGKEKLSQESDDLLARQMTRKAAIAGPFHVAAYAALTYFLPEVNSQPSASWVIILMTLATAGRIFLSLYMDYFRESPSRIKAWRLLFTLFSLMLAIGWSATATLTTLEYGPKGDSSFVQMSLFGVCALAVPAFAYDLIVLISFLQVMTIPIALACAWASPAQAYMYISLYTLYNFFLCYLAVNMHRFQIQNMLQIDLIKSLHEKMNTMIESLDEAILMIAPNGKFQNNRSRRATELFGVDPSEKTLAEVLALKSEEKESTERWVELAFSGQVDFEILKDLGPSVHFTPADNRTIALRYRPVKNQDGAVKALVLVAEDISVRVAAQDEAKANLDQAEMILQVIKNPGAFKEYLIETESLLENIAVGQLGPGPDLDRSLHNLKGSSALFRLSEFARLIHKTEVGIRKGEDSAALARDLLVFFKDWQKAQSEILAAVAISKPKLRSVKDAIDAYTGIAHSTAAKMGKTVRIKILENVQCALNDPPPKLFATLIHLFNNAIDHGLEKRNERLAKGKPPEGQIEVSIDRSFESNQTWLKLTFKDDGRGINANGLVQSIKKSHPDRAIPSAKLELFQMIFEDRISSKTEVSEISGMGTGLASVKAAAESIGGSAMVVESGPAGTIIEIKIPEHALSDSKAA